jgi:hypothetical protein
MFLFQKQQKRTRGLAVDLFIFEESQQKPKVAAIIADSMH